MRELWSDPAVPTVVESKLAALRLTWGVMVSGIFALSVWLALGVLVGWPMYADVVGPVLRGESISIPGMDPGGRQHVFSEGPSYGLIAAVALLACVVFITMRAWYERTLRRSASLRSVAAAGDDYRSAREHVADPVRADRAAARLAVVHAAIVAACALVIAAFGAYRLPVAPWFPGTDQEPKIRHAAMYFAGIVDAWCFAAIGIGLLLAVFPTRRRFASMLSQSSRPLVATR